MASGFQNVIDADGVLTRSLCKQDLTVDLTLKHFIENKEDLKWLFVDKSRKLKLS